MLRQHDQDPHLYWFADHAYRRMIDTTSKQCILVNGESGAGKTEATKSLLKHLVYVSESSVADLHERIIKVSVAIISANKLLETCFADDYRTTKRPVSQKRTVQNQRPRCVARHSALNV